MRFLNQVALISFVAAVVLLCAGPADATSAALDASEELGRGLAEWRFQQLHAQAQRRFERASISGP